MKSVKIFSTETMSMRIHMWSFEGFRSETHLHESKQAKYFDGWECIMVTSINTMEQIFQPISSDYMRISAHHLIADGHWPWWAWSIGGWGTEFMQLQPPSPRRYTVSGWAQGDAAPLGPLRSACSQGGDRSGSCWMKWWLGDNWGVLVEGTRIYILELMHSST